MLGPWPEQGPGARSRQHSTGGTADSARQRAAPTGASSRGSGQAAAGPATADGTSTSGRAAAERGPCAATLSTVAPWQVPGRWPSTVAVHGYAAGGKAEAALGASVATRVGQNHRTSLCSGKRGCGAPGRTDAPANLAALCPRHPASGILLVAAVAVLSPSTARDAACSRSRCVLVSPAPTVPRPPVFCWR